MTLSFPIPIAADLPDVQLTAAQLPAKVQILTTENVAHIVKELGITLRYDMMRRQMVFIHEQFDDSEQSQDCALQLVRDMLVRVGVKGAYGDVVQIILLLARRDRFHPMADWINSADWDGTDRFATLLASVPNESKLWPVYLRKFMVQVCQAIYGWDDSENYSLPNVLTFVGGQGMGKGRWVRALTPGYALADAELHLSAAGAKDHQIQVLKYPIVELGEIDSTFRKSDVSTLKSFLSRPEDEIREPYARKATAFRRGTCFIGTVNNAEFLSDGTGARRYWTVEITGSLKWDHGLDLQQLWAQAATWWEAGEDWNLDDADALLQIEEAEQFTMQSPGADLVAGHLSDHGADYDNYVLANKTELLQLCGITHPTLAMVSDVTQWMNNNVGRSRKLSDGGRKTKQRCWAVPRGDRINAAPTALPVSRARALALTRGWHVDAETHEEPTN